MQQVHCWAAATSVSPRGWRCSTCPVAPAGQRVPPCHASTSDLLPSLPAARKRTAPQLYIKGLTPQPKARLQEDADRTQTWEAVVAIKLHQPPIVAPVPLGRDHYSGSVWLSTGKNTKRASLTGDTYKRIIKDILLGPGNVRDGTLQPPRRPILSVQ